MQKHKWYNEIVAWASGAEIEFRFKDYLGQSWSDWLPATKPNFDAENAQYRIKPQPKEPQYLYVYQGIGELVLEKKNTIVDNMRYIGKIKLEDE